MSDNVPWRANIWFDTVRILWYLDIYSVIAYRPAIAHCGGRRIEKRVDTSSGKRKSSNRLPIGIENRTQAIWLTIVSTNHNNKVHSKYGVREAYASS